MPVAAFEPKFMKIGVLTAALQELTPRDQRDADPDLAVEEWVAFARELGADHVIDHYQQSIRDEVRRLTNRRGVDIVIEHVGKATWEQSSACLAHHGRLVTCGATTGADVPLSLAHLFARHLSLNGSFMGTMGELYDVLKLFERGLLKPVIDRTFPMSEIRAAHERLESKQQFGKIVVVP